MYRFGDSTPFPLAENFIDTVVAAVDACVEIYRIECEVEGGLGSAREARRTAGDELRRLEALGGWIEEAVGPLAPASDSTRVSEAVAARIAESARSLLRQARSEVVRRRDDAITDSRIDDLPARIRRAVAPLLLGHQLPRSQWSWRWRLDVEGRGIGELRVVCDDLIASFNASGPPETQWAGALRVADVAPGVELTVPGPLKRRRTGEVRESLDGYEIIAVDGTPSHQRLLLRPLKGRGRLVLSLRDPERPAPLALRQDDDGRVVGDVCTLSAADAEAVSLLWSRVAENAPALIAARSALVSVALGGRSLELLERPAPLAEAILESLAPLVREMRLRSRVPGELILKRDLGGDRREELFVPRAALQRRFETLPERHHRIFEAMGLGAESTIEFAATLETPAPPARRASPPRLGRSRRLTASEEAREVGELAESLQTEESYGFAPRRPERQDTSQGEAA